MVSTKVQSNAWSKRVDLIYYRKDWRWWNLQAYGAESCMLLIYLTLHTKFFKVMVTRGTRHSFPTRPPAHEDGVESVRDIVWVISTQKTLQASIQVSSKPYFHKAIQKVSRFSRLSKYTKSAWLPLQMFSSSSLRYDIRSPFYDFLLPTSGKFLVYNITPFGVTTSSDSTNQRRLMMHVCTEHIRRKDFLLEPLCDRCRAAYQVGDKKLNVLQQLRKRVLEN